MKKVIAIALILVMAMGLCACGQSAAPATETKTETTTAAEPATTEMAAEPEFVLRCGSNHAATFCTSVALQDWADMVYERTNGRIKIELYFDAVLGEEKAMLEQCAYGGLDFVRGNISPMCEFVDDFNALCMPYIYSSDEQFWKALETVGMDIMHGEKIESVGLWGLTFYDGGSRNFYNSKKDIHTPADMKGMNIRVQESSLMIGMIEALGASATAMPYADVYSGLQTGVIDGAENSFVQWIEVSHCEVAPHFTKDGHTRAPDLLVMSAATKAKLDPADVKIIEDAAYDSWLNQREYWAQAEEEALAKLDATGIDYTITELTDEEFKQFSDACSTLWTTYENGKYLDIINQIVAIE